MKYELKAEPYTGISQHAAADGQQLWVMTKGFFTPEDGNKFYKILDGLESLFLTPFVKAGGNVAKIGYFLVLVNDGIASVQIDEDQIILSGPAKRNIIAGEWVSSAD